MNTPNPTSVEAIEPLIDDALRRMLARPTRANYLRILHAVRVERLDLGTFGRTADELPFEAWFLLATDREPTGGWPVLELLVQDLDSEQIAALVSIAAKLEARGVIA